jgi:glycosyltransferase involved in cell wall biosynthesis
MKIMILAHNLRVAGGRATGINILRALKYIDQDNHYYIIIPDQTEYRVLQLEGPKRTIHYYRRLWGHLGRLVFDKFALQRIAREYRPDLIWAMGGLGFPKPPCLQAVSIQNAYVMYDIYNTCRLRMVDLLRDLFIRWAFRRQLPRTQLVICQTTSMEVHLRKVYSYVGNTIITGKVVSEFASDSTGSVPEVLIPYRSHFKLFYLSRYYPHKGLEMLVEVMSRYRKELPDTIAVITISADQHKNASRLLKKIKKLGLEDRVINVGPLLQDQLGNYYTSCDCLVMPTRLESFSGTYLEAMHFGLPILTSDLDFAHEVCGNAALYFDPWDAASIRDSIHRLKNDLNLRHNLIEKGRARLSESFDLTWGDITGNILKELYLLGNQKDVT